MKKSTGLRKIFSLFTALMILMSFMIVPASARTITDARNSVVAVLSEDGTGSGFAIGKVGQPIQYIVTNAHVVSRQDGSGNVVRYDTATVAFDLASNDFMTANVYLFDADLDLAVLKLPQPTTKREAMPLCASKYVDPDDEFAAIGYPKVPGTDWKQYSQNDMVVTKGGIKRLDRIDGQDVYMLDLATTNGNSGGPLVNSKGEIVGINTFQLNNTHNDSSEAYALVIDMLIKFIANDDIPVTLHGQMNWLFIAGGVVLLAIIALVIVLVVRKKNDTDDIYPGSNYTTPLDNGANHTAPKQTPVANKPSARVIAVGGTLNGKRYAVNGTVKVGRDSSKCAIAFPVNTQGVSGVHCEVGFDGSGVCFVKDLNSSYGTFTMDGNKLAPNTPHILKPGDKFYLASPENTFEVRF